MSVERLHAPRMPILRIRDRLWECIGWNAKGYGYNWRMAHDEYKRELARRLQNMGAPAPHQPLTFHLGTGIQKNGQEHV